MENPTNNTQPAEEEKTQDASAAQEETKGEQQESNNNNEGKSRINHYGPPMALNLSILSREQYHANQLPFYALCVSRRELRRRTILA